MSEPAIRQGRRELTAPDARPLGLPAPVARAGRGAGIAMGLAVLALLGVGSTDLDLERPSSSGVHDGDVAYLRPVARAWDPTAPDVPVTLASPIAPGEATGGLAAPVGAPVVPVTHTATFAAGRADELLGVQPIPAAPATAPVAVAYEPQGESPSEDDRATPAEAAGGPSPAGPILEPVLAVLPVGVPVSTAVGS